MIDFKYSQELYRKLIHLSSLWMPTCVYLLEAAQTQIIFFSALLLLVLFEVIRHQKHFIAYYINKIFTPVLRPEETTNSMRLTGAFYMLIGAILTSAIFPKEVAATALTVLMISDNVAALVGKRWGRHRILEKSIEGSSVFFISAVVIALFFSLLGSYPFKAFFISGCIASFVAMLFELCAQRIKLDDNLLIPLTFSFVQIVLLSLLTG